MRCEACGKPFEGTTSPRRRFCDEACRSRFRRGARAEPEPVAPDRGSLGSTETATMLALQEAGKLGTPGGQAALVLARRIDGSDRDTASGLAAMVVRLRETVAELVADVPAEDDLLDELARRREAKQRAAAGREET